MLVLPMSMHRSMMDLLNLVAVVQKDNPGMAA